MWVVFALRVRRVRECTLAMRSGQLLRGSLGWNEVKEPSSSSVDRSPKRERVMSIDVLGLFSTDDLGCSVRWAVKGLQRCFALPFFSDTIQPHHRHVPELSAPFRLHLLRRLLEVRRV